MDTIPRNSIVDRYLDKLDVTRFISVGAVFDGVVHLLFMFDNE